MFTVVFQTVDLGADVTEEEKTAIETAKAELTKALEGNDTALIKEKKEALEKAAQSVAVKAYEKVQKEQQTNNNGNNNNGSSNTNDDGSVNAEYEDIDK